MVELNIRKNNRKVLNDFKDKCIICGETSKCCLEVHHIDEKSFNISQSITSKDTESIIKELDKCICVCSNCHKKIHANLISFETFLGK